MIRFKDGKVDRVACEREWIGCNELADVIDICVPALLAYEQHPPWDGAARDALRQIGALPEGK